MRLVDGLLVRNIYIYLYISIKEDVHVADFGANSIWLFRRICWYVVRVIINIGGYELTQLKKGSALAIKTWAWQLTHGKDEPLPGEKPYANEGLLIESVKEVLEAGKKKAGRTPRVLVIGAVSLFSLVLQMG